MAKRIKENETEKELTPDQMMTISDKMIGAVDLNFLKYKWQEKLAVVTFILCLIVAFRKPYFAVSIVMFRVSLGVICYVLVLIVTMFHIIGLYVDIPFKKYVIMLAVPAGILVTSAFIVGMFSMVSPYITFYIKTYLITLGSYILHVIAMLFAFQRRVKYVKLTDKEAYLMLKKK